MGRGNLGHVEEATGAGGGEMETKGKKDTKAASTQESKNGGETDVEGLET